MTRSVRSHARALSVCAAALVMCATLATAQDQGPPTRHPGADKDFMFGRPHGSVSLRGSWVIARAGSDLFDFVADQLTLEKGDFNAPGISSELAIAIAPRLEAVAGIEYGTTRNGSEYRRFVDNRNLPIEQSTRLSTLALTGSVRFALRPRGQLLSRLAFVPRGVTPYVGGGVGAVYYDFTQTGDFVDFVDLSVFPDVFQSKGWTPSAHVFGGADLQIYRQLFLQLEGRYQWAAATLGRDFIDFDAIDLAGFRMTAGVNFLF